MGTLKQKDLTPEERKKPVRIAVKLKLPPGHPPEQRLKELTGLDFLGKAGAALPLFDLIDGKVIGSLLNKARERKHEGKLPDFSPWYQLMTPPGVHPDELVASLLKLPIVETAYAMRLIPPPTNPPKNPRNAEQGYLDPAAQGGIDARYAWQFDGGDGKDIGFVDMELGWDLTHPDLAGAGITSLPGFDYGYRDHGTSVLGQVLMANNGIGGLGIAAAAKGRVISQWRTANSTNPDNAAAIAIAADSMEPGDVLLLEAQELDPAGAQSWWPVEVVEGTYLAIEAATAAGIVVVEAAGNGENNLDNYTDSNGRRLFDRNFRDSGAIIVGAASSIPPHARLNFSNRGSRIDCYAWGENIFTTTINGQGPDYTNGFDGTSGASAIIAGAALIVQGLAVATGRGRFTPRQLRQILTTHGTALAGGVTNEIGVMPNLFNIITDNRLDQRADV